jgi:hypothetical protein
VSVLAYLLWKTLEQWQQRAGLNHSPRTILDELWTIHSTDVVLPTTDEREIRLGCVVPPTRAQTPLARPARAGFATPIADDLAALGSSPRVVPTFYATP